MINILRQIEYWSLGAENDMEAALILIENKKYVQGLFFCHLCIEKMMKALVVQKTQQIPPRSHDLFYLAEIASIKLTEEKQLIVQILMKYQLEGRYPEHMPKIPPFDQVRLYLKETENLFKWLRKKL